MNNWRIVFEKTGRAVYISHLDLMRTFQRVFQRAAVSIKHTEGFNPHAYISIALPLSLGCESVCELLDFDAPETEDVSGLPEKLNEVLPEGIRVLTIMPRGRKAKFIKWTKWEIELVYDTPGKREELIRRLFERESLMIERKTKKGTSDVELIGNIKEITVCGEGQNVLVTAVISAQEPSIRPDYLVEAICREIPEAAPDFRRFKRIEIFDENMEIFR